MSFNPKRRYSAVAVFSEDLERVVLIHKLKPDWQAVRELREETGLDVAATALQLFCKLRFKSREGDHAEHCFYTVRGDVDAARTMEAEEVFVTDVTHVLRRTAHIRRPWQDHWIPTMPNLPYLVAMARQCLRSEGAGSWPLTIYEAGAGQ